MTIIGLATLVLCNGCKATGHIQYFDGTESATFKTQEEAYATVMRGYKDNKITDYEKDALLTLIKTQTKIPSEKDLDLGNGHESEDSNDFIKNIPEEGKVTIN